MENIKTCKLEKYNKAYSPSFKKSLQDENILKFK